MKKAVELVNDMITYKESLGRKRGTYETRLMDLAKFLDKKGISNEIISIEEDILPWCERRKRESATGLRRRMAAAREFTKYLYALDLCDGLLSLDGIPKSTRFTPYIFSDSELRGIFSASDAQQLNSCNTLETEVIRVIFRLIYFCGLRPNEGRELRRKDYDTSNMTLFVRHNKAGRERTIPIAEDLNEFCAKYLHIRDQFWANSEYLFPSPDGKPYSAKWLDRRFLRLWKHAFPYSTAHVRVYDLRHRFATAVLTQWLDKGEDCFTALPYLSAYMGHNDFSSTAYYIHLLPERLLKSSGIDWEKFENLMPEVEEYE